MLLRCPYCRRTFGPEPAVRCPYCRRCMTLPARLRGDGPAALRLPRRERERPGRTASQTLTPTYAIGRQPSKALAGLALLVLAGGLLLTRAGGRATDRARHNAVARAAASVDVLGRALELFRADCGRFPTATEGFVLLLSNPDLPGWDGPYINGYKPDPWGEPYRYEPLPPLGARVTSAGPDGAFATADDIATEASALRLPDSLVVFDLETTGFSPEGDRIVELAAVELRHGVPGRSRTWLVNPGIPIPPAASRVHGITEADIRDAPPVDRVLRAFAAFAGDRPLAAHNARFDAAFLRAAAARHGLSEPPGRLIDTLELFRLALPGLQSHSLQALAAHYGIRPAAAHRAGDDARLLADMLAALQQDLPADGATQSSTDKPSM